MLLYTCFFFFYSFNDNRYISIYFFFQFKMQIVFLSSSPNIEYKYVIRGKLNFDINLERSFHYKLKTRKYIHTYRVDRTDLEHNSVSTTR